MKYIFVVVFFFSSEISDHLQKVAERERELSGLREQQQLQREPPGGQNQVREDEEPPGGYNTVNIRFELLPLLS